MMNSTGSPVMEQSCCGNGLILAIFFLVLFLKYVQRV